MCSSDLTLLAKILKVSVSLPIMFLVMCLVFYSFVGGADTSGSIDLDYMVEKLGIDKSKIDDLSNLLYKNYGTTMAGLRVLFHLLSFHFLAQNGNSLLNSEISDDL